MKSISSKLFLILFFIIIILKSVTVWSSNLEKIKIIENKTYLNKIKFYDYKKNLINVIDKKIDYYIINFWASWCAPCIKEMSSLNHLKKKFPNVKILTINQDEDIEDAKEFFTKNKYDNLEKYYDYKKEISKNFALRGLPTTFIFNKEFKAFAKVEGIIEWESEEFVNWLIKF
ncbi:MAG: Thiol:disulfide interchange protein TlpA [Alphaproteobacteria bacterium MarineAlpha9_Bin4]|nr:hypothetical protein [Pelagibacterales bacterium]PPR27402.1 MAG: Thiol:disulfide interchange protein TlpA [Alphaproteobacteria bacterium MarineAlpha9_Bin4]|tara:strand:- start:1138 stop:1656 length:519 start_codon:yes stop_codon:yes gene_type:complete